MEARQQIALQIDRLLSESTILSKSLYSAEDQGLFGVITKLQVGDTIREENGFLEF